MFHRIKTVTALPDYYLKIQFTEGVTKIYDVKPLFAIRPFFKTLENKPGLFSCAKIIPGGYAIVWNDDIALSSDELFESGETIQTPFDGLMAFSEATQLWGLNESTLRKAIAYGKLTDGVDACKIGRQWIISTKAMKREYGEPRSQTHDRLQTDVRRTKID